MSLSHPTENDFYYNFFWTRCYFKHHKWHRKYGLQTTILNMPRILHVEITNPWVSSTGSLPFQKSIGCEFIILTQLTENIQNEFSNEKHLGVLTVLSWNEVLWDQHLEAVVKVEIGLPEALCMRSLNFQGRWPASVRAYLLTHSAWNLSKSGNFLTFHCSFCMCDFLHKTLFAQVLCKFSHKFCANVTICSELQIFFYLGILWLTLSINYF